MQVNKAAAEEFIDKFGNYISEGDFDGLYKALYKHYNEPEEIGALSTFMYDAGMDFLEAMDFVPMCAFYESTLPTIIIPDCIRSIEDYAFAFSKLTSITIPKSVTEIADTAFYGCKDLGEITYLGPKDLWSDLQVRIPKNTKVNFK